MSQIKSVAVVGASGNLGPHVVKALVDANFQVTVLTRSKNSGTHNANVKVVEVDYESVESLATALEGIDGVVATVGGAAMESQTVLIDAAVAAGVKRFIPSEFGNCTTNSKLESVPPYTTMFKIKRYLQGKSPPLTWTVLACGAFLEFLFRGPLFLDYENHKATLYDEGDNRIDSTSLSNVGKAIANIFKNYEATENKVVRIAEVTISQNQLLKIAEGARPDIKWELSKIQTSTLLQEGLDMVKAGDFSMASIMKTIKGTAFAGDTYGSASDVTDNELLGVKALTEEDLKKLVVGKLT